MTRHGCGHFAFAIAIDNTKIWCFKNKNIKLETILLLLLGTHVAPEFNVVWNHSVFRRLREITADIATVAAEDKEQSICSLIAGHVPLLIWQTKECSHACSAMHSNWLWMAPRFTQGSLWWACKTGCLSGFWVKLFTRGWKQLGCSAERTHRVTHKTTKMRCRNKSSLTVQSKVPVRCARPENTDMLTSSDTQKSCCFVSVHLIQTNGV